MSEVVNLNKARKRRMRTEAAAQARENRVSYGLPKAQRETARLETARTARQLDGAKRES